MIKEYVKFYRPLLDALEDGELQWMDDNGVWNDVIESSFTLSPDRYRRKPKPREIWVNFDENDKSYGFVHTTEAEAKKHYSARTVKFIEAI